MSKRKLSKTAKRRRFIVFCIETAIVTAVMLGLIYMMGWVIHTVTSAMM